MLDTSVYLNNRSPVVLFHGPSGPVSNPEIIMLQLELRFLAQILIIIKTIHMLMIFPLLPMLENRNVENCLILTQTICSSSTVLSILIDSAVCDFR